MINIIEKDKKIKISVSIDKDLNDFLKQIESSLKKQGKKVNRSMIIQSIIRKVKDSMEAKEV